MSKPVNLWSQPIPVDKTIDLSFLSEEESFRILRIIQKDFELRVRERNRLRKLKIQLDASEKKVKILTQDNFNARYCLLCFDRFIIIFKRKYYCNYCKNAVCKKCVNYFRKFKNYICHACQQEKALFSMTCDWFYRSAIKRFLQFGSLKIMKSIEGESVQVKKEKETAKMQAMSMGLDIRLDPSKPDLISPGLKNKVKTTHSVRFTQKTNFLMRRIRNQIQMLLNSANPHSNKVFLYKQILSESKSELKQNLKDFAQVLYVQVETNSTEFNEHADVHSAVHQIIQEEVEALVGHQVDVPFEDVMSIISDADSIIPGERTQFEDRLVDILYEKAIENNLPQLRNMGIISAEELDQFHSVSNQDITRQSGLSKKQIAMHNSQTGSMDYLPFYKLPSESQSMNQDFASESAFNRGTLFFDKEKRQRSDNMESREHSYELEENTSKVELRNKSLSSQRRRFRRSRAGRSRASDISSSLVLQPSEVDSADLEEIYVLPDNDENLRDIDGSEVYDMVRPGEFAFVTSPGGTCRKSNYPRFVCPPKSLAVPESEEARFDIEIAGSEPIEVIWYKVISNEETLQIEDSDHYEIETGSRSRPGRRSMTIWDTVAEDSAEYLVTVANSFSSVTLKFTLDVNENTTAPRRPDFTVLFHDTEVPAKNLAKFNATVSGYPLPRLTFYKNGKKIVINNPKYELIRIGKKSISLCIYDVTEQDDAIYSCSARNYSGHCLTEAQLIVAPCLDVTPGGRIIKTRSEDLLSPTRAPCIPPDEQRTFNAEKFGLKLMQTQSHVMDTAADMDAAANKISHLTTEMATLENYLAKVQTQYGSQSSLSNLRQTSDAAIQSAVKFSARHRVSEILGNNQAQLDAHQSNQSNRMTQSVSMTHQLPLADFHQSKLNESDSELDMQQTHKRMGTVVAREIFSPVGQKNDTQKFQQEWTTPILYSDDRNFNLIKTTAASVNNPTYFFPPERDSEDEDVFHRQHSVPSNKRDDNPHGDRAYDIEEKIYEMAANTTSIQERIRLLEECVHPKQPTLNQSNYGGPNWQSVEREIVEALRTVDLKDLEIEDIERDVAQIMKFDREHSVEELKSNYNQSSPLRREGSLTGRNLFLKESYSESPKTPRS